MPGTTKFAKQTFEDADPRLSLPDRSNDLVRISTGKVKVLTNVSLGALTVPPRSIRNGESLGFSAAHQGQEVPPVWYRACYLRS
jgi:hypothetical protein